MNIKDKGVGTKAIILATPLLLSILGGLLTWVCSGFDLSKGDSIYAFTFIVVTPLGIYLSILLDWN